MRKFSSIGAPYVLKWRFPDENASSITAICTTLRVTLIVTSNRPTRFHRERNFGNNLLPWPSSDSAKLVDAAKFD